MDLTGIIEIGKGLFSGTDLIIFIVVMQVSLWVRSLAKHHGKKVVAAIEAFTKACNSHTEATTTLHNDIMIVNATLSGIAGPPSFLPGSVCSQNRAQSVGTHNQKVSGRQHHRA
jgi:hypothetical protein